MKRTVLAIALIVVSIFAIFCEVPIAGSRDYSLKATAFGSRLEVCHYEEIKEDMKGFDKLIDRMLSGTVRRSALYFAMMRGTICSFRSFTDLVSPVLRIRNTGRWETGKFLTASWGMW